MTEQVAAPAAGRAGRIAIFWFVVVALIGGGAFFALQDNSLMTEAKAAVRAAMKDPASVEFRNGSVSKVGDYACGEFNAKNSFGAYAGFRPFVYSQKDGLELAMDPSLAAIVCR